MSEATTTTTSSEPTITDTTTTAEPAVSAPEPEPLDASEIEAIAGGEPEAEPETITIGGHTIPVSELASLPDDVLRRIKRKVKAAGQEREVSLLEALEAVPKAEGWQRRQWEAAQYEKKIREAASALPKDAIRAVMELQGVSRGEAVDILSQQLVAELEEAELPPAERRERERRRALEERAAKADEYERQQRAQAEAKATKAAQAAHIKGMDAALGAVGIARTDYTTARMATVLAGAYDAGVIQGDCTPEDYAWAAEQVAREVAAERKTAFADPAAFIKAHPEEARAIAKAYAQGIKAKQPPPQRAPGSAAAARQERKQFSSFAEWQADANRRMGGR